VVYTVFECLRRIFAEYGLAHADYMTFLTMQYLQALRDFHFKTVKRRAVLYNTKLDEGEVAIIM